MKIGFIADIHEDLPSLKRAVQLLEKKGCDELICLGDICGYSYPYYNHKKVRNASACLDLVRKECQIIIPGNHDLHAARKTPLSNPGFNYPGDWYEKDFKERQRLAKGKVWLYEDDELESNYSDNDKDFILSLPEFIFTTIDEKKILLSHYIYPDFTGSSTRSITDKKLINKHISFMAENNCQLSFFGHSHAEGNWIIQEDFFKRKRGINLDKNNKTTGIGLPCIVKGRNNPGVSTYNSTSGAVESFRLYPKLRWRLTL